MSKRIGLVSLGCAKNQVNAEQMLHLLDEAGYEITADTEDIDAVIVNTCGFIESAKMEAINTILELAQAKCEGKIGKIIVTGCLAQRYKDELLKEMPEIDSIVGVGSYDHIVSVVGRTLNYENVEEFSDINTTNEEIGRVNTTSPAWSYLKIAEGCDNRCAYCIIPYIRGRYRSRKIENVVAEAQTMAENGIKELIVVAQGSPPSLDGFGGHRLGKNGVLHGVSPQRRQICGAGIVVRGIQAVGIGKMSVLQAQDPGLVVHPRHKALHRAAAVNGQGHGGIVAGGQHKSIQ